MKEPPFREIGERLRAARKTFKDLQPDFAKRLGVKPSTYVNYERGFRQPPVSMLERLAGLGFRDGWVIRGEGPMRLREPETGIADVAKGFEPGKGFPPSQPARLDTEKLRFALEVVEEALAQTGRTADPAGKASLVAKIYETFLQEADVAKATATVLRLIRTGT